MDIRNQVSGIVEEAQQYAEARFEQVRLSTVEKTTNSVSTILAWITVAALVFFCSLLLSALAIIALAAALDSYLFSILIVLGVYLIALVLIIVYNQTLLVQPIKNKLLGEYLKMYEKEKFKKDSHE